MRNSKLGLRALGLAVLGALSMMMAVFAAGAQAQGTAGAFLINGSSAFSPELKAKVTGAQEGLWGQLLVAARGINIKCKTTTVNSGIIENSGDALGEVTFGGCVVFSHPADAELPACTVHSSGKANGTIAANALILPRLHGEAAKTGRYVLAEHKTLIVEKEGKKVEVLDPFTTIELLGAACAAEGVYVTKGSVVAEVTAATNNTVKPLITLSEAIQKLLGDKLLFGAFEAFINGSATLELVGAHEKQTLGVH